MIDPLVLYLAQRRLNYGITQDELATTMGVSRAYLSFLETERRSPSLFMLRVWMDALSVQIDPRGVAEPRCLARRSVASVKDV